VEMLCGMEYDGGKKKIREYTKTKFKKSKISFINLTDSVERFGGKTDFKYVFGKLAVLLPGKWRHRKNTFCFIGFGPRTK
jgi:hypothetical protein